MINHNYGAFLAAAIDSVLSQTRPAAQVIVVDDGSTDNSREIIAGYGDRIIAVLKGQEGHVSAVNAGFAKVEGDLCLFLDADDVLYPTCLETAVGVWRPGDVKLQYRLDTIDRDGRDQTMPFPHFPADLDPAAVRRQAYAVGVYPWTVSSGNLFSRDFLKRLLPIDEAVIYRSPDGYINKMAPLFGDVRSLSAVLGAYRVHGANAWAQDRGGLRMEPVLRWLQFDRVLHRRFQAEAATQGVRVASPEQIRTMQQAEYQLLAVRFAPREAAMLGLTRSDGLHDGLRAALRAPNTNPLGRIAWALWLLAIALLPKGLVVALFSSARGQVGRSSLSRLIVRLSRGSAR